MTGLNALKKRSKRPRIDCKQICLPFYIGSPKMRKFAILMPFRAKIWAPQRPKMKFAGLTMY